MTPSDALSHRRPGPGGFTYIEVLVAILIIGLVTPILIGSLVGSLTHARRSEESGAAAAWVQGEIDFLRGQCYARLGPSRRKATPATLQAGEPRLPAGFAAGHIRLEAAGAANLKATVGLHKKDWTGDDPIDLPVFRATTYIGDIRVAGSCP